MAEPKTTLAAFVGCDHAITTSSGTEAPFENSAVDIATLVYGFTEPAERENEMVVKAVVTLADGATTGRAFCFTRLPAPGGPGPMYHHVGIYALRRGALDSLGRMDSTRSAPRVGFPS